MQPSADLAADYSPPRVAGQTYPSTDLPCLAWPCLDRQGNVLSCLVSPSRSLADTFLNAQPQRGGNKWQQMAADDKWIKVYSDICAVGNKSKCTTHLVLPKFCLLLWRRHFAQTDRQTDMPPTSHAHASLLTAHGFLHHIKLPQGAY